MTKLVIEYLKPNATPLSLLDLGSGYLQSQGIPFSNAMRPLRDEVEPTRSQRGNLYFDFERGRFPLPDQLETRLRINGKEVALGDTRRRESGKLFREATLDIDVDGVRFQVNVYLSLSERWCWLRIRGSTSGSTLRDNSPQMSSPGVQRQLPLHRSPWLSGEEKLKSNKESKPRPSPQAIGVQTLSSRLDAMAEILANLSRRVEKIEQRVQTIEMIMMARDSLE